MEIAQNRGWRKPTFFFLIIWASIPTPELRISGRAMVSILKVIRSVGFPRGGIRVWNKARKTRAAEFAQNRAVGEMRLPPNNPGVDISPPELRISGRARVSILNVVRSVKFPRWGNRVGDKADKLGRSKLPKTLGRRKGSSKGSMRGTSGSKRNPKIENGQNKNGK